MGQVFTLANDGIVSEARMEQIDEFDGGTEHGPVSVNSDSDNDVDTQDG